MPGQGEGPLRIAIKDFFETYVSKGIGGYFRRKVDEQTADLFTAYGDFLDKLEVRDAIPEQLQPGSPAPAVGAAIAAIPLIGGFLLMAGMSVASAVIAPISAIAANAVRRHVKDWRADPATLMALQNRFPALMERWKDDWQEAGIPDEMIEPLQAVLIPTVPEGDLLTLWYRDETKRGEIETELMARGWTEERVEKLIEVRKIIPGTGDLIRMAVREAFRPDIVEKFGYDQDVPGDIIPWFEKQGLSEDWFLKYWYSHWELPSVQAGYQMLHRLRPGVADVPFDATDLEDLMRAADIPEFFRSRLKAISFAVFTRVDVRRMYRVGVLDAEGVKAAYMDLGYDETKAEQMTEFTVKLETQEQRDLTRTNIQAGYKRQVIVRADAKIALIEIGYTEDDAEYFLAIIDFDLAKADIDDAIDEAKFLYLEGEIDDTGVYALLNPLNLPAEQIAKLIVRFELLRRRKRALPSKADVEGFYRRDLITAQMLQEALGKRRYDDDTIGLYMTQLDEEIAEEAAREAERAQQELERIAASEEADAYRQAMAIINHAIAVAQAEIADIKLVAHLADVTELVLEKLSSIAKLVLDKTDLKVEIRGYQTEIQQLKFDITEMEGEEETALSMEAILQAKIDIAAGQEQIAIRDQDIAKINDTLVKEALTDVALSWRIRMLELRSDIAALRIERAALRLPGS